MLLSAHFFSGISLFAILSIAGLVHNDYLFLLLLVSCSIIPDFDIFFSSLHRNLFTHTPFFWGSILVVIIVFNQSLWILLFPFFVHLVLDTIDYGVMLLYPFSKKTYGLKILENEPVSHSKSQVAFLREYLTNRKMIYAELIIIIITMFLLAKVMYFS
jgi:hypothetical protein